MVLRNSFFYAMGDLYPSILAFLIVPFLTHSLSTSDYGILTYVYSIIAFLSAAFGLGFNTYIFKSYSFKNYQHYNFQIFNSVFWGLFALTSIFSVALYYTLNLVQLSSQIILTNYSLYMVVIIFLSAQIAIPMSFLRIKEKAIQLVLITVSFSTIEYILTYVLVVHFDYGVEGRLFSKITGSLFYFIVVLFYFRKILFKNYFNNKYFLEALKFGPAFAVGSFLFSLIDVADRFILERYVDLHDLGLYGIAYSLSFILMALNRGIAKATQPHIIKITKENNIEQLTNTLNNAKKFVNILTFTSTIVYLLSIEYLMKLTFDTSYLKSMDYVLFLLVVPMFYAHYNIYSSVLIAKGKKRFFLNSMMIGFLINIATNFILIPYIGIYGAIAATIAAYLAMLLLTYLAFKKLLSVKLNYNGILGFSILLLTTLVLVYFKFFNSTFIHIVSVFTILSLLFGYIYFYLKIRLINDLAKLLQ